MVTSSRMTSYQRREQLIRIGRSLFAAKGFEAVSVEEIASHAKVSKPIVYEHFGGKEGLYAVIVDREMQALTSTLTAALDDPTMHPRRIVERTALALLTYIEENAEGFQVLSRDSPSTDPSGSFSSLLGDISLRVEDLLTAAFKRQKLSPKGVPYYAQMLVGMTVFTGQYWADRPKVSKEQLAAYIVDLAWHGLSRLDSKPKLLFEGERARRAAAKAAGNAAGNDATNTETTDANEAAPTAPESTAETASANDDDHTGPRDVRNTGPSDRQVG
ncbi:AcrR family transcriptional regulator [Bifidobacterium callitrichos]|nr:AcrR family transcriptional regulator [Bifidobacterium callitrichos]